MSQSLDSYTVPPPWVALWSSSLSRRGLLGIISATGLAIAGCSTPPPRPRSSAPDPTPAERNLTINRDGSLRYSPPHYPAHSNTPPANGKVERIITGAGIGYILCRIAGTWQFATACAIVWGVIGGATYNERNKVQVDMNILLGQLQSEIDRKVSRKPESLRGILVKSSPTLTQYVEIGPIVQRGDGKWYADFKVTWVDSQGQTHFGGSGTVVETTRNKWSYASTNPRSSQAR